MWLEGGVARNGSRVRSKGVEEAKLGKRHACRLGRGWLEMDENCYVSICKRPKRDPAETGVNTVSQQIGKRSALETATRLVTALFLFRRLPGPAGPATR